MTRVLCPQDHCVFWDGGICGADEITLDPEQLSCSTMEDIDDLIGPREDLDEWDDGADDEEDEWDDDRLYSDAEDDDDWEPY